MKEIKSASNFWINLFGCSLFFFSFFQLRSKFGLSEISFILICLFIGILPTLIYEIYRGYKSNDNYTLNFRHKNKFSFYRIFLKLTGLAITFAFVYGVYRLFPLYREEYYFKFYNKLLQVTDYIFILSVPYFIITDIYMRKPEDAYYHLGKIILFKFSEIDGRLIWEHAKSWFVKIFFLPLMCIYSLSNFNFLYFFDFNSIVNFKNVYDFLYTFIFTIDVIYAVVGYAMTLKLFNTQIQSAEPTVLGWLVCLMCYEPFWTGTLEPSYFKYEDGFFWGNFFIQDGVGYIIWGSLILMCLAIYSFATVAFGIRFSNITYRGTITDGPYSLTKHPAYVFKNISWWLISLPMLGNLSWEDSLRNCLMLFGINVMYFMRARTEENHLSNYPEYVAYAEMMNEKSIFAWLGNLCPFFKYNVERARKSGSRAYSLFAGRNDLVFEDTLQDNSQPPQQKELSKKEIIFGKKKR